MNHLFHIEYNENEFSIIFFEEKEVARTAYVMRLGHCCLVAKLTKEFKTYINKNNKLDFLEIVKEQIEKFKNHTSISEISFIVIGDVEKHYKKEIIRYAGLETCMTDKKMIELFLSKEVFDEGFKIMCGYILLKKEEKEKEKNFFKNLGSSLGHLRENGYVNWIYHEDFNAIELYFYRSKYRHLRFEKTKEGFHLEISKEVEVIQGTDEETITNALKKIMDRIRTKERLKYIVANDNVSYLFQEVTKTMEKTIQDELWYEMRKIYSFEELDGFVVEYLDKKEGWNPLLDFENCVVIKAGDTYHAWAGKGKTFTEESREKIIKKIITYKEKLYLEKMK